RVLLFGRPGAGKSALLGALAQAAAQPASLFKARLADESGGLAELARGAYGAKLAPTGTEVVAYPVHFEPQEPGGADWAATLLDCNGEVAQAYLLGKRPLSVSNDL